MSSRTNTPIWRTALTLTVMFWTGVGFAPLAALVLLIGESGGTIKFALMLGLASVVLIGLSVTWRRDATSVERELVTAVADVEADTHRLIAELRAEVRQLGRGAEPLRAVSGYEDAGHRSMRPQPTAAAVEPERHSRSGYVSPPRRPATIDYDELDPTDPMARQDRPDGGRSDRYDRQGRGEYAARADGYGEDYAAPRRNDRYRDEAADMVQRTEMVSVTRRETTTTRSGEIDARRHAAEPESEAGVYRGSGSKTPLTEKISKLRKPKDKKDDGFDPRAEADSLLSGLQADPTQDPDWYSDPPLAAETRRVPQQRQGRHDEPPAPSSYDSAGYGRSSRGEREEPQSGAWRTEERSAELRMGMRESRGGPEDGWQDEPSSGQSASWSVEPSARRGRHYQEAEAEPTRSISAYEADPQPRWRDYDQPAGKQRASSYMDENFGRR